MPKLSFELPSRLTPPKGSKEHRSSTSSQLDVLTTTQLHNKLVQLMDDDKYMRARLTRLQTRLNLLKSEARNTKTLDDTAAERMELRRQIESASLKIQNLKVEIEKVMDEMKKREEESKMMMG